MQIGLTLFDHLSWPLNCFYCSTAPQTPSWLFSNVPSSAAGHRCTCRDSWDRARARVSSPWAQINLDVVARDFAQVENTFFGDRPLDNPGYSALQLKGEVKAGSTDRLDVLKVEQRLKYLGYPAMHTGTPSATNNKLENFTVDGKFGADETAALKLFEKVVRYGSGSNAKFNNDLNGADGKIEADKANAQGKLTAGWLNAYNAPHWMQFFASTGNTGANQYKFVTSNAALPGWENRQFGTTNKNIENFGTNWMYDLMVAKQYSSSDLRQSGSYFNGSVDANLGITPKWMPNGIHSSHDLGMAFDLGVSNYIGPTPQSNTNEALLPSIQALANNGWSLANAVAYTANILPSGPTGLPDVTTPVAKANNQVAAIRDFLSLYSLTKADGVTVDLKSHIVNTTASNLFGGLISSVLIGGKTTLGQNPYRNINEVLGKLGISHSTEEWH